MVRSKDGRWLATCTGCGEQFQPSRAKQRYHSRECAEEHRDDWAKPKGGTRAKTGLEERVCLNEGCPRNGEPFRPVRDSQLTCSRQCRDALPASRDRRRVADKHPERRERQNELRRPSSSVASPAWQLAHRGWTPEQYETALAQQDGACQLCGRIPKPGTSWTEGVLHADHDHATGRRRNLLCGSCNKGLGLFRDDPAVLRAAAEYIERHREAQA